MRLFPNRLCELCVRDGPSVKPQCQVLSGENTNLLHIEKLHFSSQMACLFRWPPSEFEIRSPGMTQIELVIPFILSVLPKTLQKATHHSRGQTQCLRCGKAVGSIRCALLCLLRIYSRRVAREIRPVETMDALRAARLLLQQYLLPRLVPSRVSEPLTTEGDC